MSQLVDYIARDYTIIGAGNWLKTAEHDSLVIDVQQDIFYWNSKGIVGDIRTWLTRVKHYSDDMADNLIKRNSIVDTVLNSDIKPNSTVCEELVNTFFNNGKNNREYWYDRCLTDSGIDRFKLGYYEGWYLIPIFVDGKLRNFQMRRDKPERKMKNWYSGVGPLLFNSSILNVTNSIVLTEGLVDSILLNQLGIPSVSHNGGSHVWKNIWFSRLYKQKTIYIVYDNDDAGRKGAKRIAVKLGESKCKIYTFDSYPDRYDVVDFFRDKNSKDEFVDLIRNKSKYVFELGD
jgi:5S rRNA maturation endonuclease (ribonuclease M5)